MAVKKCARSAPNGQQRGIAAGGEAGLAGRSTGWQDRVVAWLDARSLPARLALIVLASLVLWGGIILGVRAVLRGMA